MEKLHSIYAPEVGECSRVDILWKGKVSQQLSIEHRWKSSGVGRKSWEKEAEKQSYSM